MPLNGNLSVTVNYRTNVIKVDTVVNYRAVICHSSSFWLLMFCMDLLWSCCIVFLSLMFYVVTWVCFCGRLNLLLTTFVCLLVCYVTIDSSCYLSQGGYVKDSTVVITFLIETSKSGMTVHLVQSARHLVNGGLTMRAHINYMLSSYYGTLRQLRSIKRSLPSHALNTLVTGLVHSWLDYCNVVFAGLPACDVQRLQSILNTVVMILELNCVCFIAVRQCYWSCWWFDSKFTRSCGVHIGWSY